MTSTPRPSAAGDGILLGLANTVVVAFCMAIGMNEHPIFEVTVMISIIGFIPAMMIGAIEGWLAELSQNLPRAGRLAILAPLPILFVLGMGQVCEILRYAAGACIPTLVAVLILERKTRSPQLVPRAVVS